MGVSTYSKRLLLVSMLLLFLQSIWAQDPFFLESRQIPAYINPALTGMNGSLTIRAIAKDQYWNNNNGGLLSGGFNIEQSIPCSKLDLGVYYITDIEGDGLLTSHFVAGNVVYTLPIETKNATHNIRFGTKVQYVQKQVSWDRFYFSDQLDAKYNITDALGIRNISSFEAPDNSSSSQMNFGFGFIHKADVGEVYKWSLAWGMAFENITNVIEDNSYDSLLGLEQEKLSLLSKYSIYISPEFPLTKSYKDYFGFKPSYIFQKHLNLSNHQMGFEVNYRKMYALGLYLNFGDGESITDDTKSIVVDSFVRIRSSDTNQLNLGIQYMHNIGGLSQVFGQTIQISFRWNYIKDGCKNTPDSKYDCPATSRRNRILYENIWFEASKGQKKKK